MLRGLSPRQLSDIGARAAALFGFWLILTGANPADIAVGVTRAGRAGSDWPTAGVSLLVFAILLGAALVTRV